MWSIRKDSEAVLVQPDNASEGSGSFLCARFWSVQRKVIAMTTFSASSVNGLSAVETPVSEPSDSKVSEWFIYLVDVPRNWDFPRHHTASPKAGPKVSYGAAAESVASMNRHYLQRYQGTSKKCWTICILRGNGYAVLQMPINNRFRPQNEFVMPKTELVEVCTVAELREKLATINKVISTFRPKSNAMKWAVAAKSIQPGNGKEVIQTGPITDPNQKKHEPEYFFRVKNEAGKILKSGYSNMREAMAFAGSHNNIQREIAIALEKDEPTFFVERYRITETGTDSLYRVVLNASGEDRSQSPEEVELSTGDTVSCVAQ